MQQSYLNDIGHYVNFVYLFERRQHVLDNIEDRIEVALDRQNP